MMARKLSSILIVEDERIVARDLQETLLNLGYDAFAVASSAEEAIAKAAEKCPDLVLMDVRIKGQRDGIETAQILRERFEVPVVYLTAHSDDATLERAAKTEPFGYLLKPVNPAELRSAIEVSVYKDALEKSQRKRERWLSMALRSIGDGVIAIDPSGRVTFMNPTAEALTGVKSEHAVGRHAREVLHLLDEQSGELLTPLPIELAFHQLGPVEITDAGLVNAADGSVRCISDSVALVVDKGRVLGAVMVFRDVSQRKKLQQQLEQASRLASLGTMAAGVAHEVNNPLTIVTANATFLADRLLQQKSELESAAGQGRPNEQGLRRLGEMAEAVSELESAASRITRIIADLSTFMRPAPGAPGQADVRRSVEWAIRSTSHELRNRARLVRELNEVSPVKADEARLGQVFVNLLVNAAQAIPTGNADSNEVTVATRTDERGRIVVEVRDTGSGIPPDVLKHVFEPFFTTKAVTGTGLGLSICHGIVTSLGGELQIESQVGKGTTFRVCLPPTDPDRTATAVCDTEPAATRRGRILVIDDEPMILTVMRRILSEHDVVTSESARNALDLLQGERFDLIFCDLSMPVMTGMDFYEELLRVLPEEVRKVVFLTGGAVTLKDDDFLRSVPNPLVKKPFEAPALSKYVQEFLRIEPGQSKSSTARP